MVFVHKFNNYPSLSSECILSSAIATYLISDILREKRDCWAFKKKRKSMNIFFIQVQWYPSSLYFEHILSLATAFQRYIVKQWDFEREKVFRCASIS